MIRFLLSLVTSNRNALIGLAAAVALSAGWGGWQTYQLARERGAHAETRAQHAEHLAGLERAAREAEALARAEEQRRIAALQGVILETEQNLERARADAIAATDAGQRLRDRIARVTASCRATAGNPAAPGTGAAADATADMLADLQRRLDEAADGIAGFADRARAAGNACEQSYRALTK